MDPPTDQEPYDDIVDRIASDAAERADDADVEDALWNAVTDVVPELTDDVSTAILERSEHEPFDDLVEQVTDHRESDAAERRRAEAITVLLQDARQRFAE